MTADSPEKRSRPVATLSMNDQPETMMHIKPVRVQLTGV